MASKWTAGIFNSLDKISANVLLPLPEPPIIEILLILFLHSSKVRVLALLEVCKVFEILFNRLPPF